MQRHPMMKGEKTMKTNFGKKMISTLMTTMVTVMIAGNVPAYSSYGYDSDWVLGGWQQIGVSVEGEMYEPDGWNEIYFDSDNICYLSLDGTRLTGAWVRAYDMEDQSGDIQMYYIAFSEDEVLMAGVMDNVLYITGNDGSIAVFVPTGGGSGYSVQNQNYSHRADGITGCWWYEYAEEDGKTYYSDGESWILFEDDHTFTMYLAGEEWNGTWTREPAYDDGEMMAYGVIIDGEKYAAALFVNDGVLMMNIDGMIVVFSPF